MSGDIPAYLLFPVLNHTWGYQQICWYAGGTTGAAVEYFVHTSLDLCYAVKALSEQQNSVPYLDQEALSDGSVGLGYLKQGTVTTCMHKCLAGQQGGPTTAPNDMGRKVQRVSINRDLRSAQ